VSSVLRPHQHSIGYMGDGFYRSKDPTNSIKVLKVKGSKGPPIGNCRRRIKCSRHQWRNVTVKGQTRDPNTLRSQSLENWKTVGRRAI